MKRTGIAIARRLRKNTTDTEQIIWKHLRSRRFSGHKFRRQVPIDNFIVDFICIERNLIIEIDGGQHGLQIHNDARRTAHLESRGFRVVRFWNNNVNENLEGVLIRVSEALRQV